MSNHGSACSIIPIDQSHLLNKELIIQSSAQGVQIALLEDKKLVELHQEKADASFAVGDLYLGKVKKLIPGLNAAFIDVGFEKDAFLHYTDLSPYARSILKFTNHSSIKSIAKIGIKFLDIKCRQVCLASSSCRY